MSNIKTIRTQKDRVLAQNLNMLDELSNTEMESIVGGERVPSTIWPLPGDLTMICDDEGCFFF